MNPVFPKHVGQVPLVCLKGSPGGPVITEIQFEIINKYVKLQMYINAYIYIKS